MMMKVSFKRVPAPKRRRRIRRKQSITQKLASRVSVLTRRNPDGTFKYAGTVGQRLSVGVFLILAGILYMIGGITLVLQVAIVIMMILIVMTLGLYLAIKYKIL